MTQELKPCPFCGRSLEYEVPAVKLDVKFYIHPRNNCLMAGMIVNEPDWNTRPIEDKLRGELETMCQYRVMNPDSREYQQMVKKSGEIAVRVLKA